jgi:hypothetical protein
VREVRLEYPSDPRAPPCCNRAIRHLEESHRDSVKTRKSKEKARRGSRFQQGGGGGGAGSYHFLSFLLF